MKLPRDLSGAELIKLLCRRFGYYSGNQTGSSSVLNFNRNFNHNPWVVESKIRIKIRIKTGMPSV